MKSKKNTKRFSSTMLLRSMVAIAAIATSVSALADDTCYLNIHGASSVFDQSYPVDEVQKLVFSDEALSVHFVDNPAYYQVHYDDLWKITLGDQPISAVESAVASQLSITYARATAIATVTGSSDIAQVALYNLQGVLLQVVTPGTNSVSLDLSQQPAGIYIVRAVSGDRTETQKIIR